MNEFEIIEAYFKKVTGTRADVLVGIGDDAAVLLPSPKQCLVVSMDTLVEGTHFVSSACAYDLGYKALAVNLSDLAAMGAIPAWFSLALTIPKVDVQWIENFSSGLLDLANEFNMQLIGGDTTKGPLSISIQVHGWVPQQKMLLRRGAEVGDKIYVSGYLGDAGLGLDVLTQHFSLPEPAREYVLKRLHKPTPQISLGVLLREFASSAIDISDGLVADLGHIAASSQVSAEIYTQKIPLSAALKSIPVEKAMLLALTAGEDYELCFTIPSAKEKEFIQALQQANILCSCIGEIKVGEGVRLLDYFHPLQRLGYQHFE